jgi:hypothetical protein
LDNRSIRVTWRQMMEERPARRRSMIFSLRPNQ